MQDGVGAVSASDGSIIGWGSFLMGRQRVVLFTPDQRMLDASMQTYEHERHDTQLTVQLEGVGLSLVNNHLSLEVVYICIKESVRIYSLIRFSAVCEL